MKRPSEHEALKAAATFALNGLVHRAPALGGPLLRELFLTPLRSTRSREGEGTLVANLSVGGRRIAVRAAGSGPAVALVHGWQGHMGQFATLRAGLMDAGFSVLSFDMPAHGESPGRTTNVAEFTETLREVARVAGPLHAVVAHSLGGAALALALRRNLALQGAVMIAPMTSFDFALDAFSQSLGLDAQGRELTAVLAEDRTGLTRADVNLLNMPEPSVPLLLIHDEEDRRTRLEDTEKLAQHWPGARLIRTRGLGHRRILDDARVIGDVTRFLHSLPRYDLYELSSHLAVLPRVEAWV